MTAHSLCHRRHLARGRLVVGGHNRRSGGRGGPGPSTRTAPTPWGTRHGAPRPAQTPPLKGPAPLRRMPTQERRPTRAVGGPGRGRYRGARPELSHKCAARLVPGGPPNAAAREGTAVRGDNTRGTTRQAAPRTRPLRQGAAAFSTGAAAAAPPPPPRRGRPHPCSRGCRVERSWSGSGPCAVRMSPGTYILVQSGDSGLYGGVGFCRQEQLLLWLGAALRP